MELTFRAVAEAAPGPKWAALFQSYRPPPYLAGCSQAIWPGAEPTLVRNYDYDPRVFDSLVLRTEWMGRAVMGISDGLFGLIDGVNDAGLAVSLTFGGRRVVGDGFGVPLILRYLLQTCDDAKQAVAVLKQIPYHIAYNVTLLDRKRHYATVFLAPDREAIVTRSPVATNHQEKIEWSSHARFTATIERQRFLLQRLTLQVDSVEKFAAVFLKRPLYSVAFDKGFGTLYTAVYRPREGALELRWPGSTLSLTLDCFPEQVITLELDRGNWIAGTGSRDGPW